MSAARHHGVQTRARKKARRYVATGAGLAVDHRRGGVALVRRRVGAADETGDADAAAPAKRRRRRRRSQWRRCPTDGGVPFDPTANRRCSRASARGCRRLDGDRHRSRRRDRRAHHDCSLGQLAIPRTRISTIATTRPRRRTSAPAQQLDDEDKPKEAHAALGLQPESGPVAEKPHAITGPASNSQLRTQWDAANHEAWNERNVGHARYPFERHLRCALQSR